MLIAARSSSAYRVAPAILQPEDAILTNQDVKETSCGVIDHDQMQLAIRVKAWRGYKAKLYPMQDLRDVEQELMLYVLERIDRFDPERGTFATFLKHALKGGIATIARRSQAACRSLPDDAEMEPLDTMVDSYEGPPVELWETLSADDLDRRTGGSSRSLTDAFELEHDVNAVVDSLSTTHQKICRCLMVEGRTKAQKHSGLTRLQFDAALVDIAERFEEAGFAFSHRLANP